MDLTKFSTNDLLALQAGDLSKVSTPGLKILQREQRVAKLKAENPGEYDPSSKEYQDKYGATSGMSTADKFFAGAGKAFTDIGRGVSQLFGGMSREEMDEVRRQDAPLMDTTAGVVGNITGNVAAAIPAVFVPGAASLPGAAAIGATQGFVQPVASDESRLKNTAIGGGAGAAGVLAARGAAATWKGGKALLEPFTQKGRERIAGRTLERFGVTGADVAGASNAPTVTGARPMLAEQIKDPAAATGAARLQDAVRALDPEIAGQMAAREAENNAARVGTMQTLAGEGGKREFHEAARQTTAKQLYDEAFNANKVATTQLSAAERAEATKLMNMPAIKEAMKEARTNAANTGVKMSNKPAGSIEGLHQMKLALDDQITALSNGTVSQINKAKAIEAARDRLVTFIERLSPKYGEARATYAAMSKPLNQMDTAAELLKRGTSATSDIAGTARLMPDRLMRAASDEAQLIKQATGRSLPQKTLADLLEPDQLAKMQAVLKETDRAAAVARAANGPGSATAQRMASQNVLRQILGPTGLPESWAESTLLNTVMRPVQFAYNGVAEPKIQAVLADLVMNPARAQAVLKLAQTAPQRLPKEVQAALPYLEQALKQSVPAAALAGQR